MKSLHSIQAIFDQMLQCFQHTQLKPEDCVRDVIDFGPAASPFCTQFDLGGDVGRLKRVGDGM